MAVETDKININDLLATEMKTTKAIGTPVISKFALPRCHLLPLSFGPHYVFS
jgi:hypothetical protein